MSLKFLTIYMLTLGSLIACDPLTPSIEEQTQAASCQSNQPCDYENYVKVWLSETNVSPETPFVINLSLPEKMQVRSAKLEGVTMYMGYIPVKFVSHKGVLVATTMVGICSERNMTWKLTVEITNKQGQLDTLFYYINVTY